MAKYNFELVYMSDVRLSGRYARAVQVLANAKQFHKILNSNFSFHVPEFDSDSIVDEEFISCIKWIPLKFNSEKNRLNKLIFFLYAMFTCVRIKLKTQKSIIYSRNLFVVILSSIMGVKSVWEMHDGLKGFYNSLLIRTVLRRLSKNLKIVTISAALKTYLIQQGIRQPADVDVAHDAADVKSYDELRHVKKSDTRDRFAIPTDKKIIMHTGSIYEGRGAHLIEPIIRTFPEMHFVQVGGTEQNVNFWSKKYQSYKNITFIGHQKNRDLILLQLSADILFYPITRNTPTYWCCSPMKIFEYLSSGIPIVASNIGSVGEVLTNEVCYTYDPEDEETLIKQVRNLLDLGSNEQNKRAVNGLKRVRDYYTWEVRVGKICDKLEFWYDSLKT